MTDAPLNHPVLLCAGHVTLDRYGQRIRPGGCVTYASLAFAALGGRSRLVSRAGVDFPRDFFPAGVEAALGESPATTVFENSYDRSGRRIQTVDRVAGPLTAGSLPDQWKNPDVLFLAPVIGEIDPAD